MATSISFDEWLASDEGVRVFGMQLRSEWVQAARCSYEAAMKTPATRRQTEPARDLHAETERLFKLCDDQDSVIRRQRGERLKLEAELDALRAALEVARRVIAHDRQSLIDCSTNPAGAIDGDAAEHVAYYDAALAQMDEATKGGSNG